MAQKHTVAYGDQKNVMPKKQNQGALAMESASLMFFDGTDALSFSCYSA